MPENEGTHDAAPFPVGTKVEYYSATAKHWIPAVVEHYSERSGTYKLDVKSSAPAKNIRASSDETPVPGPESKGSSDASSYALNQAVQVWSVSQKSWVDASVESIEGAMIYIAYPVGNGKFARKHMPAGHKHLRQKPQDAGKSTEGTAETPVAPLEKEAATPAVASAETSTNGTANGADEAAKCEEPKADERNAFDILLEMPQHGKDGSAAPAVEVLASSPENDIEDVNGLDALLAASEKPAPAPAAAAPPAADMLTSIIEGRAELEVQNSGDHERRRSSSRKHSRSRRARSGSRSRSRRKDKKDKKKKKEKDKKRRRSASRTPTPAADDDGDEQPEAPSAPPANPQEDVPLIPLGESASTPSAPSTAPAPVAPAAPAAAAPATASEAVQQFKEGAKLFTASAAAGASAASTVDDNAPWMRLSRRKRAKAGEAAAPGTTQAPVTTTLNGAAFGGAVAASFPPAAASNAAVAPPAPFVVAPAPVVATPSFSKASGPPPTVPAVSATPPPWRKAQTSFPAPPSGLVPVISAAPAGPLPGLPGPLPGIPSQLPPPGAPPGAPPPAPPLLAQPFGVPPAMPGMLPGMLHGALPGMNMFGQGVFGAPMQPMLGQVGMGALLAMNSAAYGMPR